MWSHKNLLNWGPFEGAISMLYRTLKKWLFLLCFSTIIYEKKFTLPSRGRESWFFNKVLNSKNFEPFWRSWRKRLRGYLLWKESSNFGNIDGIIGSCVGRRAYTEKEGQVQAEWKGAQKPGWLWMLNPFQVAQPVSLTVKKHPQQDCVHLYSILFSHISLQIKMPWHSGPGGQRHGPVFA